MNYQVGTLTLQQLSLKREFASIEQAVNIHLLGDWKGPGHRILSRLADGP